MASLLSEHVFRPDSVLNQPIVGLPFVDSLVRGLLLAVEHPYRAELESKPDDPTPPAIRTAVEIIEAEAERPLTISEIAARSHISARALQLGFRQHLGTTPMSYLRDVRLRRAHRAIAGIRSVGGHGVPHRLPLGFPQHRTVRGRARRPLRRESGRDSAPHTQRCPTGTLALRRRRTRQGGRQGERGSGRLIRDTVCTTPSPRAAAGAPEVLGSPIFRAPATHTPPRRHPGRRSGRWPASDRGARGRSCMPASSPPPQICSIADRSGGLRTRTR